MICTSKNGHRWTKKPLAISHGRPSFRRSSSTNRQFHRYATKSPEGIPILSQETILKHNSKLVQILSTISSWDNLSSRIYSFYQKLSQYYPQYSTICPPFSHHFRRQPRWTRPSSACPMARNFLRRSRTRS